MAPLHRVLQFCHCTLVLRQVELAMIEWVRFVGCRVSYRIGHLRATTDGYVSVLEIVALDLGWGQVVVVWCVQFCVLACEC